MSVVVTEVESGESFMCGGGYDAEWRGRGWRGFTAVYFHFELLAVVLVLVLVLVGLLGARFHLHEIMVR